MIETSDVFNLLSISLEITITFGVFHAKRIRRPSGSEHKIVSVRFQPGGRTYDYLTDLQDIQAGDTVIVNGYDGETAVTVTSVTIRRESELSLPIDRYKKILRKAEAPI